MKGTGRAGVDDLVERLAVDILALAVAPGGLDVVDTSGESAFDRVCSARPPHPELHPAADHRPNERIPPRVVTLNSRSAPNGDTASAPSRLESLIRRRRRRPRVVVVPRFAQAHVFTTIDRGIDPAIVTGPDLEPIGAWPRVSPDCPRHPDDGSRARSPPTATGHRADPRRIRASARSRPGRAASERRPGA